jgi:coenzyme F420-reducing hydrogenase alpha subunit
LFPEDVMPNGIQSTASMDAWMRLLDQAQESLERALREVEEHERLLDEAEADGGSWPGAERRCLDWIDERLRGLEGHQEVSGQLAADVEAILADDERAANDWADRATAARRRLAEMATAGIS